MTDVNDLVQQRIEAARRRIQQERERREQLAAARNRGVAHRHAAKLRHFAGIDLNNATLAASGA